LCNHSPITAGNIFENELEEILFSDYSKAWESAIPELCKPCEHWNLCKGGCRAASEQCFQSLAVEDPIVKYL
jgi:radical SAM protein with 4Fe4S-binding SPASM domain